jgi:oligopeptide transport system ATP-binding protein
MSLLTIRDLSVAYGTRSGLLHAVDRVSFDVEAGGSLAVVGESGCGKSALALAILGLLPGNGTLRGSVRFAEQELVGAPDAMLRTIRGRRIAMIFQDPMTCLTPWMRIGAQVAEPLRWHKGLSAKAGLARAIELLDAVGIPDPVSSARKYPHELSGGQRQRVVIAQALSCDPDLLIADEPTTALDVTVQAQVLGLIRQEQRRRGMALILITHNLAVARGMCERTAVMYAGRIAELAPSPALFTAACHPYTRGLLAALPRLDQPREQALHAIPGQPPRRIAAAAGCPFAPRCPFADDACRASDPPWVAMDSAHGHACVHPSAAATSSS